MKKPQIVDRIQQLESDVSESQVLKKKFPKEQHAKATG